MGNIAQRELSLGLGARILQRNQRDRTSLPTRRWRHGWSKSM